MPGARWLASLERLMDWISGFFMRVAGCACLLLVLLTTQQVMARYWFNESSVGLHELAWHLFAMIFLLAAAGTLRANEHVRVDVLYHRLSPQARAWINIAGTLVFLVPTTGVLVYYGCEFVNRALSYSSGRPGDYFARGLFDQAGMLFQVFAPFESWLRQTILVGEISPDPGGLEARWLIKACIPLGAMLLLGQSLAELAKSLRVLRGGDA